MRRAVERGLERRLARARARLAGRLRDMLPDAAIEERDDGVAITARGLTRRWVDDPSLSWWRQ